MGEYKNLDEKCKACPNCPNCQNCQKLPIDRKYALTVTEAAEYTNIGINKLIEMLKNPRCPFVLYNGCKQLVKRRILEDYLDDKIEI